MEPGEHRGGIAETFDEARAGFQGRKLATLREAGEYIAALPKKKHGAGVASSKRKR